jgi:hypothetical protein
MKTIIAVVICASLSSGCANLQRNQAAAELSGAQLADGVRETAEWTLCNAITVGAWRRGYAGDAEKSMGWAALCSQAKGLPQ